MDLHVYFFWVMSVYGVRLLSVCRDAEKPAALVRGSWGSSVKGTTGYVGTS